MKVAPALAGDSFASGQQGAGGTGGGSGVGVDQGLIVLSTEELGRDEGEPATWAIVRAGAGIATIRITAGAAGDTMAPQEGLAVLVLPGAGLSGIVEGLGADGSVITSQPLNVVPTYPTAGPACLPPPCLTPDGKSASPTIPPRQDPGPGTTVPKPETTIVMPPILPGPDQGVVDGRIACGSTGIAPPMPPPVTTIPAGQPPPPPTPAPKQGPTTVPPPTTGLAPAAPTPPIAATTATSSPPAS